MTTIASNTVSDTLAGATGKSGLLKFGIRGRLIVGFMAICLVLVAIVGFTVYETTEIDDGVSRIGELRVPTALASGAMVQNIYGSLASLRGWMLTGNEKFKTERAAIWSQIDQAEAQMTALAENWTNPDNIAKWQNFKVTLAEFRTAQERVESIAHSDAAYPANEILFKEAAPKAILLLQNITAMIDEEMTLSPTPERRRLLGAMADVRGSTGIALANIRAFLLSGDTKFSDQFAKVWAKNNTRFNDLAGMTGLMTPDQKKTFTTFSQARESFVPLPGRMFDIRKSEKWDMANYTLVKEAAPRAGKLLTILLGEMQADGTRTGGMVDNQKALLANDQAAVFGRIALLEIMSAAALGIGIVVLVVVSFLTSRSIVPPIVSIVETMRRLAQGDKSVDVPSTDRHDEVGEIAKAVLVFKDNMIEADRLAEEQERAQKERSEKAEKIMTLTNGFDKDVSSMLEGVTSSSGDMEETADTMAKVADTATERTTNVVSAAEQASNNVQMVATATEELSSSIREISSQVAESTKIASNATQQAEKTNEQVKGLATAASEISQVIELIADIAEQTNLLALNATIEAARAGDAGKGFAVVANEVKSLASQTAKATEQISTQIGAIQTETSAAVDAIGEILIVINEMNGYTSSIAAAVEEQSAATGEIARNIEEAATGTQKVSANIVEVSSAAEQTGSTAGKVKEVAGNLSEKSDQLRDQVEVFLSDIRAA